MNSMNNYIAMYVAIERTIEPRYFFSQEEFRGACNVADVTCLMFPVIKQNNRVAELHRGLAAFSL